MPQSLFPAALLCLAMAAPGAAFADDASHAPFAARMLAITDAVLERHIDPPTRQEMLLAGVKALHRAANQAAPKGLSAQISRLAAEGEIAAYLASLPAAFDSLERAEEVFAGGMLEAVPGDARLLAAEDDRVQEQIRANRYVGIGIALALSEDKTPQISKVFFHGPAYKAGVQSGDLLLAIDGRPTAGKSLEAVVQELRGEEGSELTIVVRQSAAAEPRTLAMTRGPVFIPTVEGVREKSPGEWEYLLDATARIALLRIASIGPSTLRELREVEARLWKEEVRGVILDLRAGGATLHEVVLVADALLEEGVIGHVRTLDKLETYESKPGALFSGLPLAVLVGRETASGQVFLTAALQDHGRALVIGETPAAETYVRSPVAIPGRPDKLILATGHLHRADGTLLLGPRRAHSPLARLPLPGASPPTTKRPNFLFPDHIVSAAESGEDPVLRKAIEVLKAKVHAASE